MGGLRLGAAELGEFTLATLLFEFEFESFGEVDEGVDDSGDLREIGAPEEVEGRRGVLTV